MKISKLPSILAGITITGMILISCRKETDMAPISSSKDLAAQTKKSTDIQNAQSDFRHDARAIPVGNRSKINTYFRRLLADQGITDAKRVNSFLQEQENQIRQLESTNALIQYKRVKKQHAAEWENGAAMHAACTTPDPSATTGFQYNPVVTPGWASGYVQGTMLRPACNEAKTSYYLADETGSGASMLHDARAYAFKSGQTEMGIRFYNDADPSAYNAAFALIQLYVWGSDNQWYLIAQDQSWTGSTAGLPSQFNASAIWYTTDNWRCYSVNITTLGTQTWWGAGDNIWKGTASGFYFEDDDIYYNPPCWVTNTCPDGNPCRLCDEVGEEFWRK